MIQNRLFPDLFLVDDKAARKRIWREAVKPVSGTAAYIGLLIVCVTLGQMLAAMLMVLVAQDLGIVRVPWWWDVPLRLLFSVIGALTPLWLMRRRITKNVRLHLNQEGFRLCLVCGYDLRGQVESLCSECGSPVDDLHHAA